MPELPELETDFLALMNTLGKTTIAFFPNGERLEVECWARNQGFRRIDDNSSIAGFSEERAVTAIAYYIMKDAFQSGADVHIPARGDEVSLFGRSWQIREALPIGFSDCVLMKLVLTDENAQGVRNG